MSLFRTITSKLILIGYRLNELYTKSYIYPEKRTVLKTLFRDLL